MANYLNKPISSGFRNTYTSQFVPLPLELFARANERDQRTQDAYVAQTEATNDGLWKINPIDANDKQYTDQFKQGFADAASQLVNTNLTQRENQDKVKKLIKDTSRDKDLNHIMTVSSQYQTWQENVAKAKQEGNYTPENDMGAASFANYGKAGGYKSGLGIDPTIMKYMEERPKMEQFFNDMGDNGSDTIKQAGEVYYKDGWKGLTSGRVNQKAQESFSSYANTPEGQQGMRRFALLDDKTQKTFKGGANEYVFKQFLDAGLERVHSISDSGRAAALNQKKKDEKENLNLFGNLPSQETPSTMFNGYKVDFTPDGQIKGSGRPWKEVWKESNNVVDFFSKAMSDTRPNDEERVRHINVEAGAKLNNMTPQQYASVYDKTSHMIVKEPLIGKALRDNTEVLFNGGAGVWSSLNVRNNKTGESDMNFVDAVRKVADKEGWDMPDPKKNPKEFATFLKEKGKSITGVASPNEFSLKPVIFTLGDTELVADMTFGGKTLPYDNSTTEGKKANQEAQRLSNFDKLMKGKLVPGNHDGKDGVYYRNLNKLDKAGNPTIDFKSK